MGGLQIEVNSRGEQVRLLGLREATKGKDITLTLDGRIQEVAAKLLEGKMGAIIMMDADTGEVLAMTSSPTYNPAWFAGGDEAQEAQKLFSDSSAPLLNRAITGIFPPGSVFKVPMAICALDQNAVGQNTSYLCNGYFEVGGIRFKCTHSHGIQSIVGAVAVSCNVFFYHVGLKLGDERIHHCADTFGLGRLTHIDLPYEKEGFVPSRHKRYALNKQPWFTGDTLNLSIGQGDLLVTPLQLVSMMATVANNGWEVQPHVIYKIGDQLVEKYNERGKLDIPDKNFELIKKGLRGAVSEEKGTAHVLYLSDLFVAGKTGTAQTSGGRPEHAWFIGYAKIGERTIALSVLWEFGGSSYNACLIARDLLQSIKQQNLL